MASIDKRPNGQWRARWREFLGGPQRTRSFGRKLDAEQFLIDVQHRLLTGTYTPPSAGLVTVEAYAAEWLHRRVWSPATTDRIERELRLHILPVLGRRPLASIRRSHIEEWVKALPLAPSSANAVYRTLRAMLGSAVDDGRIPRNPATGARVPSGDLPPFVPLTPREVQPVAHAVVEHVRAAVVLTAGTGLRQGEVFGLVADRVNFLRRELRVDQQLWSPSQGAPVLRPPKSRRSCRTIVLSGPGTRGAQRPHGDVRARGGRAPVPRRASPDRPSASMDAHPPSGEHCGPQERAWHDLRHHHASDLLSKGVNPAKVVERLGHDLKTLLEAYAHVMPKDDDRVRSIVDESLGGSAEDWLRTDAV